MAEEKEGVKRREWLREGIAVALASVFVYSVTFLYEAGYSSHFGIPWQFISVDATGILVAGFGGATVLWTIASTANLISASWPSLSPPLKLLIVRQGSALIPLSCGTLAFWGQAGGWISLGAIVLLAFVGFVLPLISKRRVVGYRQKLEAANGGADKRPPMLFDKLAFDIGGIRLQVAPVAWTFAYCCLMGGMGVANNQREFLLVDLQPECVVLRVYGDKLICAPLLRDKKVVEKRFFVLKLGGEPRQQLRIENVGPLKPQESTALKGP